MTRVRVDLGGARLPPRSDLSASLSAVASAKAGASATAEALAKEAGIGCAASRPHASPPCSALSQPLAVWFSNLKPLPSPDDSGISWPWAKVPRLAIIGSFAAAAIYAGAFFRAFGGLDHWPGSASYVHLARNLLHGHGFSYDGIHPTALRPPLYPLMLAATMSVTGDHWFLATILLQAVGAAMCIVMVFGIARAIWPRSRAPWLSAALLALHGPFMFEMLSLRETVWFTLALLGVAWLLLERTPHAASAVALGGFLASLYLLRPTGLMVCGVTIAFLVWKAVRLPSGDVRPLAISLVASLLLVAPWQAFTWRNFSTPGFFPTSSSGYNLAKGADADLAVVSPWIDADALDPQLRKLTQTVPGNQERATDKVLRRIAIGLIRKSPGTAIYRSMASALQFVSPLPIPLGTGTLRQTPGGLTIENFHPDWEEIAFTPVTILLLVSACGGLRYLLWREEGPSFFGLWMAIVFLSFLIVHALTFTKTRYRLPLDALLAVPAGAWLAGLKSKSGSGGSYGMTESGSRDPFMSHPVK